MFDNVGLVNYLAGTKKAGGPLVTTSNKNYTSDLRIFTSDSPPNSTVKAMASSQTAFENTCFTIFEKMINTVPNGVVLSNSVTPPSNWITMEASLDLTAAGVPVGLYFIISS